MPMLGHFMNNIRYLHTKASSKSHNVFFSKRAKQDLSLARYFLKKANEGISLNLLTFREPTTTYVGDASEYGLGGYSSKGKAWSFVIPQKLRGRAHINLLEFMTQLINIWIDILDGSIRRFDCILCIGDNTSAMGWLRRSNFKENNEDDNDWIVKQSVARKLANLVLSSETMLYRQWLKGQHNIVSDSLSRDTYFMSCKSHESFLHSVCPNQLPNNFRICQLPKEISSFVTSTLQQLPVKEQRLTQQKPSELALGNPGIISSLVLDSVIPPILKACQGSKEILSSQLSAKQLEKLPSHQDIMKIWWKEQLQPPSHMWHRPLGQLTGKTQDWTKMEKPVSSSKSN